MAQPKTSPYPLLPMSEAIRIIAQSLSPIPPTTLPLSSALHAILAESVPSPHPHPPFDASIKDGYAIILPQFQTITPTKTYTLSETQSHATASDRPPAELPSPAHAAYVATGAPLPPNANAVVMVERVIADNNNRTITLLDDPMHITPGTDIRTTGSDLQQRQIVLPAGVRLGAAEIGLLAACGVSHVRAHPRPVIAVLSSGDELVVADRTDALPYGAIRDSNRPMLLAAIREALPFCDALDLGHVRDDRDAVEKALRDASAKAHVVITSGGVSMGKRDYVKPVLEHIGTVRFGRVLMKPGKPLTFATLADDRCVVALPGNPVSCFVCFHLAVAVAARRLAGWDVDDAVARVVEVTLAHDFKLDKHRPEYHRAQLQWVRGRGWLATSTGKQASSRLLSARGADALLALPARDGVLKEGDTVEAYLLPNLACGGWQGMPVAS